MGHLAPEGPDELGVPHRRPACRRRRPAGRRRRRHVASGGVGVDLLRILEREPGQDGAGRRWRSVPVHAGAEVEPDADRPATGVSTLRAEVDAGRYRGTLHTLPPCRAAAPTTQEHRGAPLIHLPFTLPIRPTENGGSLAGFPTAITPAGRSLVTTAPAPTTLSSPMVTPGQDDGPAAQPDVVADDDRSGRLPLRSPGLGLDRVGGRQQLDAGPIWTSSPMVMAPTSSATSPTFTKTLAPIRRW